MLEIIRIIRFQSAREHTFRIHLVMLRFLFFMTQYVVSSNTKYIPKTATFKYFYLIVDKLSTLCHLSTIRCR